MHHQAFAFVSSLSFPSTLDCLPLRSPLSAVTPFLSTPLSPRPPCALASLLCHFISINPCDEEGMMKSVPPLTHLCSIAACQSHVLPGSSEVLCRIKEGGGESRGSAEKGEGAAQQAQGGARRAAQGTSPSPPSPSMAPTSSLPTVIPCSSVSPNPETCVDPPPP